VTAIERGSILRVRERTALLRGDEELLAEERQLAVAMRVVEGDDVGQRLDRQTRTTGQIRIQVGLELCSTSISLAS
jgi:hypothetical protein